jgi:hypothetical protein
MPYTNHRDASLYAKALDNIQHIQSKTQATLCPGPYSTELIIFLGQKARA